MASLAHCLSDLELAKVFSGQVSSFFGEVWLDQKTGFAAEFGIRVDDLKTLAAAFSAWSGESYQLAV